MSRNKQDKDIREREEEPSETVFTLLLSIENRLSTIENSMKWFRGIARIGVVAIFGFFGLDAGGLL